METKERTKQNKTKQIIVNLDNLYNQAEQQQHSITFSQHIYLSLKKKTNTKISS